MQTLIAWVVCALVASVVSQEVLQNGGFESLDHWDCWSPIQCKIVTDSHSGAGAMEVHNRKKYWQGPSQYINVTRGTGYEVSAHIKLQNDRSIGHRVELQVEFEMTDGTHEYKRAASQEETRVDDGWVHLIGLFYVPNKDVRLTRIHYQGPEEGISFVVDDASVKRLPAGAAAADVSSEIDRLRRSNIVVHVTAGGNINHGQVSIRVVQKKKSFPFGTAVAAWAYNDASKTKYRDFIHQHYNWAVPENALKWDSIEPTRGHKNYQPGLNMIHGLKSHGEFGVSEIPPPPHVLNRIKVRGHNLVWSVDERVQSWIKALHGDELRKVVHDHIVETVNTFKGLVEHWDVNNENLHGQWYQHQLNDPNYNIELFRMTHAADPNVKLFLNDYNVVANSGSTNAYLQQGKQVKAANVGLYGLGAQCHFGEETNPDPAGIKQRLDTLAQVGVPIWATELDVVATDENKRADFYEHALTALYSHHAVEGILMWGFWDKAHWRHQQAALVVGDNLQLTAAGRRVLELYEHRWMTDETHNLSAGTQFTVRGFHGDYEVHVIYQGQERTNLKQTFTLGNAAHTVNINIS
ncbi:hypothetical protein C0Q70_14050 [Pomacea canaliculata]|uniref:GH10 domain-containing protein n=1 Tax=Pomacea canaliculata TaxID=400727 RepID=A0A2T7NYZ1_POMCA|nr:hypothetical protein C0Q70_14050 [Pomacea canaliculata]